MLFFEKLICIYVVYIRTYLTDLMSRELLVSLNALQNHAYIQLNCYIVQFCQACCPSHVFVLYPIIVIFAFVWRMLSLCDVFCFLFLVVDIKISGVGVLLRFCW